MNSTGKNNFREDKAVRESSEIQASDEQNSALVIRENEDGALNPDQVLAQGNFVIKAGRREMSSIERNDPPVERRRPSEEQDLIFVIEENEEKASSQEQALIERYFGTKREENPLDKRIVAYFTIYLRPEETMRRLKNMHPTSKERLITAIEAGDVEKVVEMMEAHIQGMMSQLREAVAAFSGVPEDVSDWRKWNNEGKEARSNIGDRHHVIRNIMDKLNRDYAE